MATSTSEKKPWTVKTPAGEIYCDYASEAHEYKKTYGYIIYRTKENEIAVCCCKNTECLNHKGGFCMAAKFNCDDRLHNF